MLRASAVIRKADLAGRICIDTVTLDREARYRRRVAMKTDRGHEFLLDLADATYLADGDVLALSSGALVRVLAAPEELFEIHVANTKALAQLAWHIGNRHTPAEITADAIYVKPDHVLADMIAGLGGHVHRVMRPWEPEGGAYGGKGKLATGHDHGAAADHDHGHDHGHAHDDHTHPHDHKHHHDH